MIEEDPEPAVKANLMARMAAANAECEDALVEIERIAASYKTRSVTTPPY